MTFTVLPIYEDELAKVSNNSLENNKKIKNSYKRYKKESFCWGGYWSDRNLFYKEFDKLKLKIMNHYTQTFMKPILAPILDMSYYLPEFSGFDPETLFDIEQEKKDKAFRLAMDIDKILKANTNQTNTNKKGTKENFLRRIYIKSNPDLAKNLLKISNTIFLLVLPILFQKINLKTNILYIFYKYLNFSSNLVNL